MQAQVSAHGVCGLYGGNVLWNLKGDTLFIHGKGEMANYERTGPNGIGYAAPWKKEYSNQIKCVVIEDSVTSVGEYAFLFCSQLKSVVLPQTLKAIKSGAFEECIALDSIAIPDSVSIGVYAFIGCTSLHVIKLPKYLLALGYAAFRSCVSLDSIRIPKGIRSLEGDTFQDCTSLHYVDIPNSVTSLGGGAFSGCSALDSITIPNSVTSMGGLVFDGCTSLKSVKLSEKLFSIVKQFYDNSNNILAQKTKRIRRLKRSSPEQIIPTGGTQTDCVGEAIAYYYNLDINVVNDSLSRVFPCYADSGIHRNNLLRAVQLFNSTASSQNCFTETTPVNETSIYGIAEIPGHAVNTIAIVKVAGHYRITLLDSKNSICYCFDIKSNTVPALDYFDNYPLIPQYIK
jgi:hypothetical protein